MSRRLVLPFVLTLLMSVVPLSTQARAAATLWVDIDSMAGPNNCSETTAAYPTITMAVGAAAPSGDTIMVCPGTYTENVVLSKSLTLNGAQFGVDARGRTAASESIVIPMTVTTATLELQAGSIGSTIDGFTFLGGAFSGPTSGHFGAIESTGGPIDGLQILNNRIRGFTAGSGVFLNNNGINITVNQNDIDGTAKVGTGDLFHLDQDNFDGFWFTNNRVVNGLSATGFFVDGTRNADNGPGSRVPLFKGNLLDRNQTGANLGRLAWGDGPITENTFSNNDFDGLQGGPKKASITQNTFASNGRNGLALTGFSTLPSTDTTRGAQFNTIERNCFTRNGVTRAGAGIFFNGTQAPGTMGSNVVRQNNITGNAMGARYGLPGPDTINAQKNWWGDPSGPGAPDGSGTGDGVDGHTKIDFSNWLPVPASGTPCSAGAPFTLDLQPDTAINDVDTQHCVTATVLDMAGNPVPGITVRFTVTGSVNTSGPATTDANGEATFCYTGPPLPGADTIEAYADTNNNNTQDAPPPAGDEPFDVATKEWTPPLSTPFCDAKITDGGWIIARNTDRANFGGNASVDKDGNPTGQQEYQDQGPIQPMNVHSTKITATTCNDSFTEASIFGEATIDGTAPGPGQWVFRIDVVDMGSASTMGDRYRIRLSNGYDSGDQALKGGNITIHKAQ
jgi:hypothetical protein